jgi:hypothetical protein
MVDDDANIGEGIANSNNNTLIDDNVENVNYIKVEHDFAKDFWKATMENTVRVNKKIWNDIDDIILTLSLQGKDAYQSLPIELNNRINSFEDIVRTKIPLLPRELKTKLLKNIEQAKTAVSGIVDNTIHQVQTNTNVQIEEENEHGNQRNAASTGDKHYNHDTQQNGTHAAVCSVSKENIADTLLHIKTDDAKRCWGTPENDAAPNPMNTIQPIHIQRNDYNLALPYDEITKEYKNIDLNDVQFAAVQKLLETLRSKDEVISSKDQELLGAHEVIRSKDQELLGAHEVIRSKDQELLGAHEVIRSKDEVIRNKDEIHKVMGALHNAGSDINLHLINVFAIVTEIATTLSEISGLNQADPTTVGSTLTKSSKPPVDPNIAPNDRIPGMAESKKQYMELDKEAEQNFDFDLSGNQQCEKLKAVNEKLQTFIADSSTNIINYQKMGDISNTIAKLEGMLFGDESKKTEGTKVYEYPGTTSNEKDGFQPIFHLILRAVANCIPTIIPSIEADAPSSPTKNRSRREVGLLGTTFRNKRCVDFVIEDEGRFYIYLNDYAMQLVCEGKPGCRKNNNPLVILDEARGQALSHVAKYVAAGLNFAGIGTNTFGTCVIATLAVVQVLRLELSGVGTIDMKLQLKKSRMLPLMTKLNYEKWILGSRYPNEFEDLGKQLYPQSTDLDHIEIDDSNHDSQEDGIPLGILCLYNLMMKRRVDLFGPNDLFKGNNVGALIGRGTFSDIYSYQTTNVIKISRYGVSKDLQNEGKILMLLKPDIELQGLTCLPIFHNYIPDFEAYLGDLTVVLPALETSPRGIVSTRAMNRTINKVSKGELLSSIKNDISYALKFIHSKNVFHLDVAPKNIVIIPDEKSGRAVLIDFSVAWHNEPNCSNKLSGFIGTPSYTHRDIFYFYPSTEWAPHPKYDFVGLGYTLATLANEGKLPFPPFNGFPTAMNNEDRRNKFEEICKERDDACCAAIDESCFSNRRKKLAYKKIIEVNSITVRNTVRPCRKRKNA